MENTNHYLLGIDRLSDVLAAIQFLGTYKFYKISLEYWDGRMKNKPKSADSWKQLFIDHPEFFRYSEEEGNVCLIMRRARPKNYNVDTGEIIDRAELEKMTGKAKERISREHLSPSEIATLMNVAIDLHNRSIAHEEERRWKITLLAPAMGMIGVILGALIKSL
jgi:hypothetical protein